MGNADNQEPMHECQQEFMKNLLCSIAIKLKTALQNSLSEEKMKEAHYKNKGTGLKELHTGQIWDNSSTKYHLIEKEFISNTDNIQIHQEGGKF